MNYYKYRYYDGFEYYCMNYYKYYYYDGFTINTIATIITRTTIITNIATTTIT